MLLFGLLCTLALGSEPSPFRVLPEPGQSLGYAEHTEAGKWIVFGPDGFRPVQPTILGGGTAALWQGTAGEYAVICLPPGDAQPVVAVVELGGGSPDPEPDPDPQPTPGATWGIIVEETSERTPEQAQVYSRLRQQVQLNQVLLLDQDNPGPAERYVQVARESGHALPVLVAISADGEVVSTQPCPMDVGAILEACGIDE
jgi:hypothetical protein